ncbi:unnamed protein product [Dibothriocephalus latus]|uniref:Reverse transcriptase domain-containing protein n=1 Tax=Dibothriocephalus latus TaxID=60516 RepID=A0A3P7LRM0_DIBLA|nr:unnamed protein product [Dibothriocephalus latus]
MENFITDILLSSYMEILNRSQPIELRLWFPPRSSRTESTDDGTRHGQRDGFEAFAATNGVKQDCVLAASLFSLLFSVVLVDVYRDECPVICIAYRTDRHILNLRRMQAPTRTFTATVHDLLFAEDCALNTTREEDM